MGRVSALAGPNFAATAGLYSQLAGVLAGFAFAGLVALIAAQFTSGSSAKWSFQSFVPLISAFIGLVSSSLNYAIIASDDAPLRSALIETIGGLGFSVAGVMLFYSLLVLLHGAHTDAAATAPADGADKAVQFVRRLTLFGVSPTVMILLLGGIHDQETARQAGKAELHWSDYAAIGIAIAVVAVVAIQVRIQATHSSASSTATPPPAGPVAVFAAGISLVSVIAATLVEEYAGPSKTVPNFVGVLEMLLLGGFVIYCARSACTYR